MKKTLLIAAFAAFTGSSAFAQMANNSICPDWTGTDINGNTHDLYSLLDSGYTVFIDVSATWCVPCWEYRDTGALENLYTTYGPGTAQNKVRVFFIEGQSGNTVAQINGTSSPSNACSSADANTYYHGCTRGDWTDGTPYPIIDDEAIGNLLQITYFPTIFKICPNRVITTMNQPSMSQMWNSVSSCQEAVSPSDGTLLPSLGSIAACVGNDVQLTTRLQNLGTSPMTSASIEARQGPTVLGTIDWTGTLGTYDVELVPVTNYSPTSSSTVTFHITSSDDNATNNTSSTSVTASSVTAASTQVTLELQTDNYGSETTWKLFDPSGSVFAQGGPYPNSTTSPLRTFDWNLQDASCYRLEIYDAYGDGFCCSYGNGYYHVISNGETILTGTTFTNTIVKLFSVDATTGFNSNELERSLNVYPNPTNGLLNLEYSMDQGATINITISDVVGKVVMEHTIRRASGFQSKTLDLNDLSNGMYVLKVNAGSHQATRTITLNK